MPPDRGVQLSNASVLLKTGLITRSSKSAHHSDSCTDCRLPFTAVLHACRVIHWGMRDEHSRTAIHMTRSTTDLLQAAADGTATSSKLGLWLQRGLTLWVRAAAAEKQRLCWARRVSLQAWVRVVQTRLPAQSPPKQSCMIPLVMAFAFFPSLARVQICRQ